MEEFVRQTMLYDFYGDLLTAHQQRLFEAVVFNDIGYSEAAMQEGISRQGVHDLIRRCSRQLESYEKKLHLVERFLVIRESVDEIRRKAQDAADGKTQLDPGQILELADRIRKEL